MSVVRSIEDVGPSRKAVTVEVPAEAVDAETSRITKDFGRQVKLPGFRPGKVPAHVVRQRFREDIDKEVVERLVPRYWRQAESEAALEPLGQPELAGIEDHESGEPLVFTAHVEVRPEIELGNIEDFQLPEPAGEPTDEELETALEDLRRRAGDWIPVERPAAQGDLVAVGIRPAPQEKTEEAREDAEAEDATPADEEPEMETVEVEIGSPNVWEELSVALTGRSEGQSATFSRMEEEDGQVEERTFELEVRGVKEREVPELDDELAAELGEFESVEELRDAVRRQLAAEKASKSAEERERALLDQLRERHPLALPQGVVDSEIQGMVQDYAQNLAGRGVDVENADVDWRAMGEQARPMAEKRVHARLLLDAVADHLDLRISDEELEQMLGRIASEQGASTQAVRRALDSDGRLAGIKGQMRRAKAVRRLLGEEDASGAAGEGGEAAAGEEAGEAAPASGTVESE